MTPHFRLPAEAPVVLYGAAGEEEVLGRWRGQLREALRGLLGVMEGMLRMEGEACTVWCRIEAGDALVSFDFRPVSLQGKAAGSLFAFPASPLPGKDFSVSAGPMPDYNYGVATYHCSLCRGDTGMTNLRRTGRGLRMLSSVRPDPCRELGRTYRVEILKYGPTIQVFVDGRLFHSYYDAGAYGPPLSRGRFGIRHFAGGVMVSMVDDFEIAEPAEER